VTHSEWLACGGDVAAMLEFLTQSTFGPAGLRREDAERERRRSLTPSDRKLRLFACACWRLVFPDDASQREAADVEAQCDGPPDVAAAAAARWHGAPFFWISEPSALSCAEAAASMIAGGERGGAALLREIVGDPFDPLPPRPAALLTPDVLAVARAAYEGRDWALLPLLADALADAGCDHGGLLRHLRLAPSREHSPRCGTAYRGCAPECPKDAWERNGPHALGCWALDCILGKE
jgi:hypothetical protein